MRRGIDGNSRTLRDEVVRFRRLLFKNVVRVLMSFGGTSSMHGEMINTFKVLVGKPGGKRAPPRTKRRKKNNFKMKFPRSVFLKHNLRRVFEGFL